MVDKELPDEYWASLGAAPRSGEVFYNEDDNELGHIYYYMAYSNDSVPLILRGGANRGFHEAFGTMLGMASLQLPFLKKGSSIFSHN